MKLVSFIFSLVLLFALSGDVAYAMQPRGVGTFSAEPTLKQSYELSHARHSGYYALWNALCGLDQNLQNVRLDRNQFVTYLNKWEQSIKIQRSAGWLKSAPVSDLNINELETLVAQLGLDGDNITLVCLQNDAQRVALAQEINEKLFSRIERFRVDNQTQAIIINTNFEAVAGRENHFITVVFSVSPDAHIDCKIYNSSSIPQEGSVYINQVLKPIYHLFEEVNFNFFQKEKFVQRVQRYLEAVQQNPLSWKYICTLEDYAVMLAVISGGLNRNFSSADLQAAFVKKIQDLRLNFLMSSENNGDINPNYAQCLANNVIPALWQTIDKINHLIIEKRLFELKVAYQPVPLQALAFNEVKRAYKVARMAHEAFVQSVLDCQIPQDIIDAALAPVPLG